MNLSEPAVYSDPKKFWVDVSPELRKDEAKNSLLLGVSYNFQSDPTDCVYQLAVRGPSGLLAALVCSRFRTNLNFVPSPVESVDHATKLFIEFQKQKLAINSIIAEAETADIYKSFFEGVGKKIKVHMTQGIYRCTKVIMPEVAGNLRFRIAGADDVEKIGEWIETFLQEAVPHDPPVNGREVAKTKIEKGLIYVLERNRELVAMAGSARDFGTSCSINLVYTPIEFRKNGFGSIVAAQLTQHFLNSGKRETNLYTDMTNPTSNKIYQKIGYEFVCDSVHLGVED